jgi:hypothetical protein
MTDLEYFKATFGLADEDVLLVPFGSRVYGTHAENSDHDYLAIVPAGRRRMRGEGYRRGAVNIQVYNCHEFQEQLHKHQVHAVEAYFLPGGPCRETFEFHLDPRKLRAEWLRKSSHSFVKAKKKFLAEGDAPAGRKSLFHALRIVEFGIQLARTGRLTDYAAANHWWREIRERPEEDWAPYRDRYQPEHNRLCGAFRRATRRP